MRDQMTRIAETSCIIVSKIFETWNFDSANTTNENQIKGARKLEDLTDVVEFITKMFEDYDVECH